MRSFETLIVWQKVHDLMHGNLYEALQVFPGEETELSNQIRQTFVQVLIYVSEGHRKSDDAEFVRLWQIAIGYSSELEQHLSHAHDLELIKASTYQSIKNDLIEIEGMIQGFIRKFRTES